MATYKLLNNMGGVILRLLNPQQKSYNKITAQTGDFKDFLNISMPEPTISGIEIKIPNWRVTITSRN